MLFGRFNTISIGKTILKAGILIAIVTMAMLAPSKQVFAAIGCTLSNPAEDLKYLYPEMSTYKEDLQEFTRMKDGKNLLVALRERLGSDID